jgi:hypothetical protein
MFPFAPLVTAPMRDPDKPSGATPQSFVGPANRAPMIHPPPGVSRADRFDRRDQKPLFEVPIWWSALVAPLAARIHRVPVVQPMGLTARCKITPPPAISLRESAKKRTSRGRTFVMRILQLAVGSVGEVTARTETPLPWWSGKPSVRSSTQTRLTAHAEIQRHERVSLDFIRNT